jgi:hypothetical protein
MNWRILISPYTIVAGFAVGILLLTMSANGWLWAYSFGALLLSVMLVFDRQREFPVQLGRRRGGYPERRSCRRRPDRHGHGGFPGRIG